MSASKESIGFIGVGLMGQGMARNLVDKGFPLTVMGHRNRKPVEALVAAGAKEAGTPKELAQNATIIFLCVTGSAQVEAVVNGPDGIAAGARPGTVIVDCSTSDPGVTVRLAAELEAKGLHLADAPLGGTPAQAALGQLSAMVGAAPEVFARIKPACEAWAQKVVHLGPVGDGHKMKLLNNFLSMGYAAIYSEALTLAQKIGITPQTFDSVLRGSRMDCGFYQTFMQYVLERDRDAHKFTLVNALKDVRYLESVANAAGVPNPVGNAVKNAFASAVAAGKGEDYVPMLSDWIASQNGISLAGKG
ncbi:3-hydroxyisobutyrate dehydrogenase-like beta-hydroxyacid dehydrogenase [Bosea sp. BE125]|uniref:NAD(P)-dependent oxidoreductase n=1 Tax=Bosea sp. BE125 TaxID=2817909 RepID=UPI0028606EFF|nr:NAD(P)-dependent oxidoreductase [Bosea sp. BE125]MDR6874397.1 3-hydroxyisobutyrate dehydrogenase-like beta-hydroxyacid dehydrogenase [Bosea sp. BE125]